MCSKWDLNLIISTVTEMISTEFFWLKENKLQITSGNRQTTKIVLKETLLTFINSAIVCINCVNC